MSVSPRIKVILHDLVAIALAWIAALFARFNFELPPQELLVPTLTALPLALCVQAVMSWRFGLYRGLWRFASLPDLWNIIRAAALGTVTIGIILVLINRLEGIPRSVLILYPFFLVFLLGGPRLLYRVWKDRSIGLRNLNPETQVVIVGGGAGGEMVVRDMLREGSYIPIGIVDDDESLVRSRIHGVPVLGKIEDLPQIVERHGIDTIVIAIPSATNAQMRHIVDACEKTGKPFRTLPPLHDMVSGRVSIQALREVSIDDLLGRDKVVLDWTLIQSEIAGKSVMVSGGGGSIGSELCRQVASLGAACLIVFERSEHNLYLIEKELRDTHPHLNLHAVIGDVCDHVAVENVFHRFKPELIFHAAAYKHVPILQSQVREAVRNNVFGTAEMIEAACRHGTASFVLISTDKAVRPSSVMGATKRLAELLCECRNRTSKTKFLTVRFGNVLGSAGSVVPLFTEQIAAGGPVTVTHPEARRYFMTIPEACQLILQAGAAGSGGEIFVLDMGEPVNITYLAEQMIRLSGRDPGVDIKIIYTGLRAGEKLSEELFHETEALTPTSHGKLLLAQHAEVDPKALDALVSELNAATDAFNQEKVEDLLRQAIPELVGEGEADTAAANVVSFTRSVP
jgi:FlaA1/EpsC-like NDP-sugar epimerase